MKLWVVFLIGMLLCVSCGKTNLYEEALSGDKKQQGVVALDTGEYSKAITYFSEYLNDHPTEDSVRSLLASAYLKNAGIDSFQIAGGIYDNSKIKSNTFQAILASFFVPSSSTFTNLDQAISTLSSVSQGNKTQDYYFLLGLAYSSYAFLLVNQNCLDSSLTLSSSSINSLSDTLGASIYDNLFSSYTYFSNAGLSASSNLGLDELLTVYNSVSSLLGSNTSAGKNTAVKSFLNSKV